MFDPAQQYNTAKQKSVLKLELDLPEHEYAEEEQHNDRSKNQSMREGEESEENTPKLIFVN